LTLQENAMWLEMVVCKGEDYIATVSHVHSQLQWTQEGDEGSKFYFDYLKRKVALDRVLGLHKVTLHC